MPIFLHTLLTFRSPTSQPWPVLEHTLHASIELEVLRWRSFHHSQLPSVGLIADLLQIVRSTRSHCFDLSGREWYISTTFPVQWVITLTYCLTSSADHFLDHTLRTVHTQVRSNRDHEWSVVITISKSSQFSRFHRLNHVQSPNGTESYRRLR